LVDGYRTKLDTAAATTELAEKKEDPYAVDWKPFLKGKLGDAVKTGLVRFSLDNLAKKINTLPETLQLHPRVAKIYEDRRKMMAGELLLDWGFADDLGCATLLT